MSASIDFLEQTLEMVQTSTKVYTIPVKRKDGTPFDLTGSTIYFTAKESPDDLDANAVFQKSTAGGIVITDAPNGIAQVTIDPADTTSLKLDKDRLKILFWDVKVITTSLDAFVVGKGDLRVLAPVTLATT